MSKGKKIGLVFSILVIAGGLFYLGLGQFGKNLVYFFTPSEVIGFNQDYYGKKIRVGGMVVQGSMQVVPNTLKISFRLTDGAATIPVDFEGIPPDLFKEGKGAVVEGFWDTQKRFHSNLIMAKHSEDYMPIEMKQAGIQFPKKDLLKTLQQ
ncbi:MAG: cytochrome c maturation protein CcmE [Nitrospirae bacterium]|nr:cytochrome c maturation protein CcmE [Nitrospirota bacterium]